MTISTHDELEASVIEIHPWGVNIRTSDGAVGYVDNTKNPRWVAGEPGPEIGEFIHVVVIDSDQTPFRASALRQDVEIGRRARQSTG